MPSSSTPADLHIANLLRIAAADARDAKVLLAVKGRNAAYLAEQAVEKIMLALLISEDIQVFSKDSHRLDVLLDKLPQQNPLRATLAELTALTAYATTFR